MTVCLDSRSVAYLELRNGCIPLSTSKRKAKSLLIESSSGEYALRLRVDNRASFVEFSAS